ncbi:MAG: hypothetical protein A2W81_02780 [Betaproteobacteria bacterium RIFCSPLOWO2_12_61_14]|nr:MAG: hypothetical protein A2W81_02780 [Betaproteobacteria bacterium RIFCSPLOWO2_12_61_14]
MQCSLLRDVLAHAVPFQRRLAADMKSGDLLLEHDEARVQRQGFTGSAIDPPSQSLEPTRAGIVDREIGRDPELGELRRGDRGTHGQTGIEGI